MKRKGVSILLSLIVTVLLFGFSAYGQDKENDVYVIERGDTLWDLSEEYLNNPYQWPELWQRNQYITNPNVIFPGNSLRLYGRPGYGPPEASPGAVTEEEVLFEEAEVPELEEMGEEPVVAKKRTPGAEEEIVELFRKGGVDYVILEGESLGSIIDARYEKRLLAQGDVVYVAMKEKPPTVGERFLIFRTKKMVKNPYTKERGKKIYVVGALQITAIKGVLYQAEITDSMDAVLRGDEIMTYRTLQ